MQNVKMRKLFVKGEVLSYAKDDDYYYCLVSITNDGWFVCKKAFTVKDEDELKRKFYDYIESVEFEELLRRKDHESIGV